MKKRQFFLEKKAKIIFFLIFSLSFLHQGNAGRIEIDRGASLLGETISVTEEGVVEGKILSEGGIDLLLFRLPSFFSQIESSEEKSKCRFFPLKKPKFLLCTKSQEPLVFPFSAHLDPEKRTAKSFLLEKHNSRTIFSRHKWIKISPEKRENTKNYDESSISPVLPDQRSSILEIPKKRALLLSEPISRILTDKNSEYEIVARAKIGSEIQPVIFEKGKISFEGDFSAIDRVALFTADGEILSETQAIDEEGNAFFQAFSTNIAEGGEFIFLGIILNEVKTGGSFSVHFSGATARSFWNGELLEGGFFEKTSPVFLLATNKLLAEKSVNQPENLKIGRNELLKFDLEVVGDESVALHRLFVNFTANSSDSSFALHRIRLLEEGNLVAGLLGSDLRGNQIFQIGDCADEVCQKSTVTISRKKTFVLEAEIIGSFSRKTLLNTEIRINGNSNEEDGIEWSDESGSIFRWIDRDKMRLENRIENAVRSL